MNGVEAIVSWRGQIVACERWSPGQRGQLLGRSFAVGESIPIGTHELSPGLLVTFTNVHRELAKAPPQQHDPLWMAIRIWTVAAMAGLALMLLMTPPPLLTSDELSVPNLIIATYRQPPKPAPTPVVRHTTDRLRKKPAAVAKPATQKSRSQDREAVRKALASLGLSATDAVIDARLGNAIGDALAHLGTGTHMAAVGVGNSSRGIGGSAQAVGIGSITGNRSCCGGAEGNINMNATGKRTLQVTSDPTQITYIGSLSREEIQRVMKRAHAQVRYCYEKELSQHPSLEGTASTHFLINASGAVQGLQVDGLDGGGGAQVKGCIQRVLQRLQFPTPKGGGVVDVRYPFALTNGG